MLILPKLLVAPLIQQVDITEAVTVVAARPHLLVVAVEVGDHPRAEVFHPPMTTRPLGEVGVAHLVVVAADTLAVVVGNVCAHL